MRSLFIISVLAMAAPAAAQVPYALRFDGAQWAEQQAARQREIAVYNELGALDARVRTDEALRDLERQRAQAQPPAKGAEGIKAGGLASMPDDRLTASNARVRAAARNRR